MRQQLVDQLFQFLNVSDWAQATMVLLSFVFFGAILAAVLIAVFTPRSK